MLFLRDHDPEMDDFPQNINVMSPSGEQSAIHVATQQSKTTTSSYEYMTMATNRLEQLPDELLQTILQYITPRDNVNVASTSRRLNKESNEPLLWRHYCQQTFDYWSEGDIYSSHAAKATPRLPWKKRFIDRILRDGKNMDLFEDMLETQQGRIDRMQEIANSGYEAREMLFGLTKCSDNAEDVLARRYWAEATLGLIQRTRALDTWYRLEEDAEPDLEESLVAFDLFVLGTRKGELEDVTAKLDGIAQDIRTAHPDLDQLDLTQKVATIIDYLHTNKIVGNPDHDRYHGIENNFISFALFMEPHHSLPLQSTAIFISIARRLGILACFCNFPTHIYAMIPLDQSADSFWSRDGPTDNTLYVDPWAHANIVQVPDLHLQLRTLGIASDSHNAYLAPAETRDMVLRTGRNIMRSWEETRRRIIDPHPHIDSDTAFYAFLWSMLLVGAAEPQREMNIHRRRSYLPYLLETFQHNFPEDVGLVEDYITRMLEGHPQRQDYFRLTAELRAGDANAKPVMRREGEAGARTVRFKVGQVFQHKRYGYTGVVVGWDPKCLAGETWIVQMGVDSLPQGRGQTFYHIV